MHYQRVRFAGVADVGCGEACPIMTGASQGAERAHATARQEEINNYEHQKYAHTISSK